VDRDHAAFLDTPSLQVEREEHVEISLNTIPNQQAFEVGPFRSVDEKASRVRDVGILRSPAQERARHRRAAGFRS
jgi:hypothetical protein